jgi:ubiquinone/menaquinone biosynthesis C-methylase UbiE
MKREARDTFAEVAELYDKVRPSYPGQLLEELFELTQLPPRARILEIGSGTGITRRKVATNDICQAHQASDCPKPATKMR